MTTGRQSKKNEEGGECMTKYAVELFFDERTEQYIRGLWRELEQNGITDSMMSIAEIQPHLTVAVYDDLEAGEFEEEIAFFMQGAPSLPVRFDSLACFPASGTLFLSPAVTAGLMQLHQRFHSRFHKLRPKAAPYYLPGSWNPHCTLAVNLSSVQLKEAFHYILDRFSPFQAGLQQIGLVQLTFNEEQLCIRSRTIFTLPLTDA
ncbi:2'-5' RNA ligase family protein [Paenibacillus residui]|uniref:2'-5' RNA ligase family protein n=2 Tax=Paenibacillus TaxID=44249 RepID=A0ABW3DBR6_9BACL